PRGREGVEAVLVGVPCGGVEELAAAVGGLAPAPGARARGGVGAVVALRGVAVVLHEAVVARRAGGGGRAGHGTVLRRCRARVNKGRRVVDRESTAFAGAGRGAVDSGLEMTRSDVRVAGRRGPLLGPVDRAWSTGECVLVAGEAGHRDTGLALGAPGW